GRRMVERETTGQPQAGPTGTLKKGSAGGDPLIGSMLHPGTGQRGHSGMLVGWTSRLHGAWLQNTLNAPSGRHRLPSPREDRSHVTGPTTKPLEECARGRRLVGRSERAG